MKTNVPMYADVARPTGETTHWRICQGPLCAAWLVIPAGREVECERCGTSADYRAPRVR